MNSDDLPKRPKIAAPSTPILKNTADNDEAHPVTDTVIVEDQGNNSKENQADSPTETRSKPKPEPEQPAETAVAIDTGSPPPKVVTRHNQNNSDDINAILAEKNRVNINPTPTPKVEVPQKLKSTAPVAASGSNVNAILVGIATFSLIIGISGWALYFKATQSSSVGASETATTTTSPSPTATPTEKPVDRSKITLEVLNGSGVAGAAGKYADKMKALGYTISKTGNADNSDYTKSEVLIAGSLKESEVLLKDLKDTLDIASQSGTLKDAEVSARIIIGTDLAKE